MTSGDAAFYGAISFLTGVAAATIGANVYAYILILAVCLSAAAFRRKINIAVFCVVFFLFLFGAFHYHLYNNIEENGRNIVFDKPISFSGIVSAEPKPGEKFQKLELELLPPSAGSIVVLASLFPEINYGDVIKAEGVIESPSKKGSEPVAFFPKIEISERHRGFWLKEKLVDFKKSLIAQFETFLPSRSAALLGGLTFGWQGDFTNEFKQEMSLSGTTHLVALSGYNITILVLAVAAVFGYFFSRRITFYLAGLVILLFVLMVGAEASVLRAAIMGFLALLAKETGRLSNVRNAVALTAAIMVFTNPNMLFDIGFSLSFLSLLGIVYLEPAFKKLFRIYPEPSRRITDKAKGDFLSWRENGLTTLSAQLAVLPVLILNFGQFSLTSIAANILILELVPLTMLLGFLLAGVSSLFHYLGFLIALPVNILLQYQIYIIKLFSYLRLPLTTGFGSWVIIMAYYGILIIFAKHYYESTDKKV
ncbi:MAG: ComEC/Rec2 family competence protein [Candidatus Liptonbacteria bacterium]|nr:ComEC/Rec2 family competence protein [Candidatus Liptonbacteria bacterium]